MGTYLNPGNNGFSGIRNDIYIDKSGLIGLINQTIETPRRLTCVSRPRRFGKSFAAQMLCAYYDKTCDSSGLFKDLTIAKDPSYATHLNRYDVIYLNMTDVLGETTAEDLIGFIKRNIVRELREAYPTLAVVEGFGATLVNAVAAAGNKFIMIIDEWDAPIREHPAVQRAYLGFLRTLFKSSATTARTFAAAYMTGILPIRKHRTIRVVGWRANFSSDAIADFAGLLAVNQEICKRQMAEKAPPDVAARLCGDSVKKDGSQSAVSDFQEFTMLKPGPFAQYVGFTDEEVRRLCADGGADYREMKAWYDGYALRGTGSIYNPNSVVKALLYGDYDSYWTETSAAGSLMHYISRDVNGLRKTVAELIGGVEVAVDTKGFSNDLITFRGRDDILTLLIHLGYLAYDESTKRARIPNEEVRLEFVRTIRADTSPDTMQRVQQSDRLIMDTIHMDAEAVAAQIEKVHIEATNPLNANSENALRAVIQLAYFSYKDHYMKMEELPTGYGYADIVYLPKQGEMVPALVIELKWNQSADAAIAQIKRKKYPTVLQGYGGDILLVGISYGKDAPAGQRKYTCIIEKWEK